MELQINVGRVAIHTFSVVAKAHLRLAEANGVLALANAIELLEFCLVDALEFITQFKFGSYAVDLAMHSLG